MDHIKLWEIVAAGIAGCLITVWVLPVLSFMLLSNSNRTRVIIEPGIPAEGLNKDHWDFPITITNTSHLTLRNVIAFVTIEYDEADSREDPDILTDKTLIPGRPLTLSWNRQPDGENHCMDIHEGGMEVLNVFRRHTTKNRIYLLEISSEHGFFNPVSKQPGGLLLNGAKDYDFIVTVMADNVFPIIERYRFDLYTADVLERPDPVAIPGPLDAVDSLHL